MIRPSAAVAIRQRAAVGAVLALSLLLIPAPAFAGILGSNSSLGGFVAMPGHNLFQVRDDQDTRVALWRTDGTAEGTFRLDPEDGPAWIFVDHLGADGGVAFLAVVHGAGGALWRTDGTAEGTVRLASFGQRLVADVRGDGWHEALGRLSFFVVTDNRDEPELWSSDGTVAGTAPVGVALAVDTFVRHMAPGPGATMFIAHRTGELDHTLWRTDGTADGTFVVGSLPHFNGSDLLPIGDRLLWLVSDFCTLDVHATDGTTLLPLQVSVTDGECRNTYVDAMAYGDHVYFSAFDSAHDQELWRSDGTDAGTTRLTDVEQEEIFYRGGVGSIDGSGSLVPIGNELWFSLGADHDSEPWRTDGTPEGTVRVADLCAGECSSNPQQFTAVGGEAWFVTEMPDGERIVYRSDGSEAGTRFRSAFPAYPRLGIDWTRLIPFADGLLLASDLGLGSGEQLYQLSDVQFETLTDLPYGEAIAIPAAAFRAPAASRVLFAFDDGLHGHEPWVSDGTPEGTHLLVDLEPFGTATTPPPRPTGLRVRETGPADVRLDWEVADAYTSTTNGLAIVEARLVVGDWYEVAVVDHGAGSAVIDAAAFNFPHSYRVRLRNAAGDGPRSDVVSITLLSQDLLDGPCAPDELTLCFDDGRFSVSALWRNQHDEGDQGLGFAIHGDAGDRSGYFWFFNPDNVELIVKILDGEALTGQPWVFYGALSDVEYWITVVDHQERRSVTYRNAPGEVCGRGDTSPFDGPDLPGPAVTAVTAPLGSTPPLRALAFDAAPRGEATGLDRTTAATHPQEPCVEDAGTLCLADGRFQVRVAWQDQHNGGSGVGGALPFSDLSGFFWFFREDNVELVVKVLDGTPVNGKVWFFYGALSDVGYTIEVVDTADGHTVRQYVNAPGNLCGEADTTAF